MFDALSKWRQRRVLQRVAVPDALWREAVGLLPFLAIYTAGELERLRAKVVLLRPASSSVLPT